MGLINLLLAAQFILVTRWANRRRMAISCPPRANILTSFSIHCSHDVPRGSPEQAATATSGGFNTVDLDAAENGTLTNANTPTTANTLGLAIQADDVGYVAVVQMGTPPRDFHVLVDSGSADLWVGAEGCKSVTGNDCVSFTSDLFFPFINWLILTVL